MSKMEIEAPAKLLERSMRTNPDGSATLILAYVDGTVIEATMLDSGDVNIATNRNYTVIPHPEKPDVELVKFLEGFIEPPQE
jgi:hypothetical protein